MRGITAGISVPLRLTLGFILVLATLLTAYCGHLALQARGLLFPSFVVDPYGYYSAAELPTWGLDPKNRPDQVIGASGQSIGDHTQWGNMPADRLRNALQASVDVGHIELTVRNGLVEKTHTYPIRRMGLTEIGFFFGVYLIAAWLVLCSGFVVILAAGRRLGARAYLFWSVATFIFLLTFFDYHSTMRLCGLFAASTVAVPVGFGALAYAFPVPPRSHPRAVRAAFLAFVAIAALVVLWLALSPAFSHNARWLQVWMPFVAASMIVGLAVSIAVRYRRADGQERQELLSTLWGLTWTPMVVAAILLAGAVSGNALFHLAVPFVVPTIPFAIGFSLARHNILASTLLLSRAMVAVPVFLLCLLVSATAGLVASTSLRHGGVDGVLALVVTVLCFVLMHRNIRRATYRSLFPARSQFRPTVEQLGDAINTLRSRETVSQAIVATIKTWLPVDEVRVLSETEIATLPHLPPDAHDKLQTGEHVWTLETPWQRKLVLPMRSLGHARAMLWLAPKHQGALYTSEDLALLKTIAGMGATALHTVEAVAELETLRRLELAVTRQDKALTVELLVAEISHEIAYPLNFFRFLLRRAESGDQLVNKDLEIGREEIERLGRMLSHLRRLRAASPNLGAVHLEDVVRRAIALLHGLFAEHGTNVESDVADDLVVRADSDQLLQAVTNLLKNAAQAAGAMGIVGVHYRPDDDGGILEVYDSGPGVSPDIEATLFDPWVTAKEGGSGLGLAITSRIVQGFGWPIAFTRSGGRTRFQIKIAAASIVSGAP